MKLINVILLSLSIAFLIMGIHQIIMVGFGNAYWVLMLAIICFLLYGYQKRR
jgi:hypothetical protein